MSRESQHAQAFVPIIAEKLGLELGTKFARLAFMGKVPSEASEALDEGYRVLSISRHDGGEEALTDLALELADTVMAAHTCAVAFGIDLDAAITDKLRTLCDRFGVTVEGGDRRDAGAWDAIRAWERAATEWKDRALAAEAQITAVRALCDERDNPNWGKRAGLMMTKWVRALLDGGPAPDVHKPFTDDGITYCGWDKHEGCGEVWPCATERAKALFLADATPRPRRTIRTTVAPTKCGRHGLAEPCRLCAS